MVLNKSLKKISDMVSNKSLKKKCTVDSSNEKENLTSKQDIDLPSGERNSSQQQSSSDLIGEKRNSRQRLDVVSTDEEEEERGKSSQQQHQLSRKNFSSRGVGLTESDPSSQQQTSTRVTLQIDSEEKSNTDIISTINSREKCDINATLTYLGEKSNVGVISQTNLEEEEEEEEGEEEGEEEEEDEEGDEERDEEEDKKEDEEEDKDEEQSRANITSKKSHVKETSYSIVTRSKSKNQNTEERNTTAQGTKSNTTTQNTKESDTTSSTNKKKRPSKEPNTRSSNNDQCKSVYARATSDMAFKMMHCNEKRIHFSEHVLSAIVSSDPCNHDDPKIGRKARFRPPFHGKLSIVETSQWKETHDDCLTEMDSCFKIEGTGQYIIMEVQRW
jgi:hypothetical protein